MLGTKRPCSSQVDNWGQEDPSPHQLGKESFGFNSSVEELESQDFTLLLKMEMQTVFPDRKAQCHKHNQVRCKG